jgi:hypothetical protein
MDRLPDAEGERAVELLAEVLDAAVVVDLRRDLRGGVAEALRDGADVDARFPEQRAMRVTEVVGPQLARER